MLEHRDIHPPQRIECVVLSCRRDEAKGGEGPLSMSKARNPGSSFLMDGNFYRQPVRSQSRWEVGRGR